MSPYKKRVIVNIKKLFKRQELDCTIKEYFTILIHQGIIVVIYCTFRNQFFLLWNQIDYYLKEEKTFTWKNIFSGEWRHTWCVAYMVDGGTSSLWLIVSCLCYQIGKTIHKFCVSSSQKSCGKTMHKFCVNSSQKKLWDFLEEILREFFL